MKHGFDQFQRPADAYDRFIGRYWAVLAAALSDFAGVGRACEPWMSDAGPARSRSVLVEPTRSRQRQGG